MQKNTLGRWSWRVLIGGTLVFALYSNINVFLRNQTLGQRANQSQAEVEAIKQRNYRLQLLLAYYQTQSYQETEARRRLGLKKPDETAVIIKGATSAQTTEQFANQDLFEISKPQPVTPPSNASQWWQYFFGKK